MKLAIVCVAAALAAGCNGVVPNAGQEAVLIHKPWIFGHGGVNPAPVKAGRSWVAITTQAVYVDMVPQQHGIHFDDLMSSDGVPLDFDAVVRLQVTDSVKLISNFGVNWFENNVQAEFANRVRQSVRKHGMNETAIQTTAVDAIDAEVSKAMIDYLAQAKLPLRLIDVTVGRANPPDSIKTQRVETAAQEQRANTERQRKLAEDQRKEAEQARAASDNAYRNALGMSSDQFIQLEAIHAQREICLKGGCTLIMGGSTPIVNVGGK
jgi:regulator of protease activity HflC (stomatin/prohibitin superfamily)